LTCEGRRDRARWGFRGRGQGKMHGEQKEDTKHSAAEPQPDSSQVTSDEQGKSPRRDDLQAWKYSAAGPQPNQLLRDLCVQQIKTQRAQSLRDLCVWSFDGHRGHGEKSPQNSNVPNTTATGNEAKNTSTTKLSERSLNVIENKGPMRNTRERSLNVVDNKYT